MAKRAKSMRAAGSTGPSRKLVVDMFVSLDGVLQAPGGPDEDPESGFPHGGWSMTLWDEQMGRVMGETMARPSELLLGRKTYDIFAGYWPKRHDPQGDILNRATKYVASRTKTKVDWNHSSLLRGDVPSAVRELKRKPGPPLHVIGSGNLVQTLLKNDLVDELEMWIFPVVLGSGKRLFGEGAIPTAWKLTRSETSSTGVLLLHYERAGDIVYGTAPPADEADAA